MISDIGNLLEEVRESSKRPLDIGVYGGAVENSLDLLNAVERHLIVLKGPEEKGAEVNVTVIAKAINEELRYGPFSFTRLCEKYGFLKEETEMITLVIMHLVDLHYPGNVDLKSRIPWKIYKNYDLERVKQSLLK